MGRLTRYLQQLGVLSKYYIEYTIQSKDVLYTYTTRSHYQKETAWERGKWEISKKIARIPDGKVVTHMFIQIYKGKVINHSRPMPKYYQVDHHYETID